MFLYTRIADEKANLQGLLGVDERGNIFYYGHKKLVEPLNALFNTTTSLFTQVKYYNETRKEEVKTTQNELWLNEFRRQVPAPYWGGRAEQAEGQLNLVIMDIWNNGVDEHDNSEPEGRHWQ